MQGECKKKETFNYFHWEDANDNDELFAWLVEYGGFEKDDICTDGELVLGVEEPLDAAFPIFNMRYFSYLVVNEDYEVIEFDKHQFNSIYEVVE